MPDTNFHLPPLDSLEFSADSIVDTVREPLLVLSADLRVRKANRAFFRTFQVSPEETVGNLVYDLGNQQWDLPPLRKLLEEILLANTVFDDFEVDHVFPGIGRKSMLLNARRISHPDNSTESILLAIEDISARRAAEEERQSMENRYTSLVQNIRDHSIFMMDLEGNIISWNAEAERIIGYGESEILGRNFSAIFTPEDIQNGLPGLELQLAQQNGRAEDERWHLRKDQTRFWALGIVTPIYDPQGSLIGYSKILRDMTDRKVVELELEKSEKRLRFILDSIPQKIVTTQANGDVDYFNPQWIEYTGLSFEEIKDWGWTQFIHPDDLSEHVRLWRDSLSTGQNYEFKSRFRGADGSYRWHISRAVPMRDDSGGITMWIGTNPDVDDIMRIEAALKLSEVRYRRLFQTAKDGILILDAGTGKIIDVNPFIKDLLEYDREELVGKELWEIGLFKDIQENRSAYVELKKQGYVRYEHLPLKTRSGGSVEVEFVSNVYSENDHDVIQCNIRDITDRSTLERQTQEQATTLADLYRRKDEFLAMLSHELRNPLAPILSAVQLLQLQPVEAGNQKMACAVIERQVGQLIHLVNDLMEVSRAISGKIDLRLEEIPLDKIIDRAVETARPLIDQRRQQITVSLPPDPIWLNADAARLEQVVTNLLTNAAKYTPEGGRISISAAREEAFAVLRVRDNGIGISAEFLPIVFELFSQAERSSERAQGGLGVGLALVKRLVELHQGTVSVASKLGQGSEFIVSLPIHLPRMSAEGLPSESVEAIQESDSSLRVLIVDDNADAAATLEMLVRQMGHLTWIEHTGPAGLANAVQHRPDVILLDIGLPGFDGYEVAKRIRLHVLLQGTVLVAMTGYGQETDRMRSQDAGIDHHLTKPADFAKVRQILMAVLGKRKADHATDDS